MEERVKAYMNRHAMIRPGMRIAVALSGGADSVCLFHILRNLSEVECQAVHVHHGLREAADRDEEFVRALCEQYGVPLTVFHVDVPKAAKEKRMSTEEAARLLRYEAFMALEVDRVAIAHHERDQAETVLLHLIRGTGLKGLGGMRPVQGRYIRPLLEETPDAIRDYLRQHGYTWVEDETNEDPAYRRNEIRGQLLPELRKMNGGIERTLARTADILWQEEAFLDEESRRRYQTMRTKEGLVVSQLNEEPPAMKSRILRLFLEEEGVQKNISEAHIRALDHLTATQSGRSISLPGGLVVAREFDLLCRKEAENEAPTEETSLSEVPWHGRIDRFSLELDISFVKNVKFDTFSQNNYTKTFDYDTMEQSLVIRTRRPGDYLTIGCAGSERLLHKSLKEYMIDAKIPAHMRDAIPLLADGSHIWWVIGHRMSDGCKIRPETTRAIRVHVQTK